MTLEALEHFKRPSKQGGGLCHKYFNRQKVFVAFDEVGFENFPLGEKEKIPKLYPKTSKKLTFR